jgi:hypothetical protein
MGMLHLQTLYYQVPNSTRFSTKLPSSESLLKTQDRVQKSKLPEDGTLVPKHAAVKI